MNKRAFTLALTGILCTTALATAVVAPETMQTPDPPRVERETRTVEKVVIKKVPVDKPDGYMSEGECSALEAGTTMADMMATYGWPANDNGKSSAGMLYYMIRGRSDVCSVDTFGGTVNTIAYLAR
jgi:hypothetical protein